MIAFPEPEPIALAGDLVHAEWNQDADPPRWEVVLPFTCYACPHGCCDSLDPTSVTFTTVDVSCDECDRIRREEGGDVTVTELD